jgi:hypothetical protein
LKKRGGDGGGDWAGEPWWHGPPPGLELPPKSCMLPGLQTRPCHAPTREGRDFIYVMGCYDSCGGGGRAKAKVQQVFTHAPETGETTALNSSRVRQSGRIMCGPRASGG